MIMRKLKVELIFFCLFCLVCNNLIAKNEGDTEENPLIGFMGAGPEDFAIVKELGASAIVCMYSKMTGAEIDDFIKDARGHGLIPVLRFLSKNHFQTPAGRIDFGKFEEALRDYFDGSTILDNGDPVLLYVLDEPGPPITTGDLCQLYRIVKDFCSNLKTIVNLSDPRVVEAYLKSAKPGCIFTDVILLTVTEKKMRDNPKYIEDANKIAKKVKELFPKMEVVPAIAMVGFLIKRGDRTYKIPMPSPEWLIEVCKEILACEYLDNSLLCYSFSLRSPWVWRIIEDVLGEEKYCNAFKYVLEKAKQKHYSKFGLPEDSEEESQIQLRDSLSR